MQKETSLTGHHSNVKKTDAGYASNNLPSINTTHDEESWDQITRLLRRLGYTGHIALFTDEINHIKEAGVNFVVDLYAGASNGFADDVWHDLAPDFTGVWDRRKNKREEE